MSILWEHDSQNDPIYKVWATANLEEEDCTIDDGAPKDAIAVTWSDNYWQPVSQSSSNYDENYDTHLMDYQDYKTYGVWAKIDDAAWQNNTVNCDGNTKEFQVGFDTNVEKLDTTNEYNLNMEYLHNWNVGGAYIITSFNLDPFGINFGGYFVDSWKLEETRKSSKLLEQASNDGEYMLDYIRAPTA